MSILVKTAVGLIPLWVLISYARHLKTVDPRQKLNDQYGLKAIIQQHSILGNFWHKPAIQQKQLIGNLPPTRHAILARVRACNQHPLLMIHLDNLPTAMHSAAHTFMAFGFQPSLHFFTNTSF